MKIKVNGKEVEVKEGDAIETPPKEPVVPPKEGEEGEADEKLLAQAKKIGKSIAAEALAELNLGDATGISKKLDKFIKNQFGEDAKLNKILHGKDLYAGTSELTKEEKIIGFFYGLVTQNHAILKALAEGTNSGADGGYLFPNEFLNEIIRDLPNLNVMRQYVRVVPMKRDAMDITSLVNPLQVFWTAENAAKSTTTARFSQTTLTAYKMAAIIYSSDELIEDSTEVDVVSFIIQLFTEAIALEEEHVIWMGTGSGQPSGLSPSSAIASINGTGNAFNDITSLFYALPRKYRVNAAFFCNDSVAKAIEGTKDTNNRPLFVIGTDGLAPTLKGKPLVYSDWCPDRTLWFGDMKQGYFLGDRKRITAKVSNDTETAFTKDQTAIRVVARIGGLVANGKAIRKIVNF